MEKNLTAPLSHEEFASLKEVGKGMTQRTIPTAHRDKLLRLKLIEQVLGGLKLTAAGEWRAAKGK